MKPKSIMINDRTEIVIFRDQIVLVRTTPGRFSSCMWYPVRLVWAKHDKSRRGLHFQRNPKSDITF